MNAAVAILSDPHFHDIAFGGPGKTGDGLVVRTLADTVASTRVFNESAAAFRAALDDIATRGIRLVVIAGDLTDDGQATNWAALDKVLTHYAEVHGVRFFATPGNHDQFGVDGRDQAKRALNADGSFDLIASTASLVDGNARQQVVVPGMRCVGYAEMLDRQTPLGYRRDPRDLHWECPFGPSDALADRQVDIASADGTASARVTDASYLVEPVEGLWLLSLDGNVYVPNGPDGAVVDLSEAGWNAALTHKPYLLQWVADVARRARAQGKTLLAFSHYPVTDITEGTYADEALLGRSTPANRRRMPERGVAEAFVDAGIRVHFSGHWHINNTGRVTHGGKAVVNVAVPSLVALPAAYKIARLAGDRLDIETVAVGDAPGFDIAYSRYRAEADRNGGRFGDVLGADTLGAFLETHQALLVRERYLPREWPRPFAELVRQLTLVDVAALGRHADPLAYSEAADWLGLQRAESDEPPKRDRFIDMFIAFYRLRKAGGLAFARIGARRLGVYRSLVALYAGKAWAEGCVQADMALFVRMIGRYLAGRPSVDFSVCLENGDLGSSPAVTGAARSVATPAGPRRS